MIIISRKILALVIILVIFSSCQSSNAPELVTAGNETATGTRRPPVVAKDLNQQIELARLEKDQALRASSDSPIPAAERAGFKGLNYFPIDAAYRVESQLKRYQNPETVKMATSAGSPDSYIRYAAVRFTIDGVDCTLDAFKLTGENSRRLFIPFRDLTSGKESYGAGRYLELEDDGGSQYTLDFNLAYNPYCAYNVDFSCPIPPQQNSLKVAVRAGEKSYHN